MINRNKHIRLFECCIPVKGYVRSIIYDLIRRDYSFIPNELYDILTKYPHKKISHIIRKYGKANRKTIFEYFYFLIQKEYIFLCSKKEKKRFPQLKLTYEYPYLIDNVIIEISKKSTFDYQSIFNQLDDLGNIDLQLKFIDSFSLQEISDILLLTQTNRIKYIEIYLPIIPSMHYDELLEFLKKNLRVSKVVFFKCIDDICNFIENNDLASIEFTKKDLSENDDCGQICSKYFVLEMSFFLESRLYNNCLNRKLAITCNGSLKNCLHFTSTFGNIHSDSIREIIMQGDFQKLWNIHKDKIIGCKACEFRYMCSDCRAHRVDDSDIYSKPKYCNYNPYEIKYS